MSSDGSSRVTEQDRVESFHYPPISMAGELSLPPLGPLGTQEAGMQRQLAGAVDEARSKGFRDGQMQAARDAAVALEQERLAVTRAMEEFAKERTQYFRAVETEVVRLALSIARKILHREVQLDPLLLAGVVRVALDQIEAGTRVVLRAAPASSGMWTEFCSRHGQSLPHVEVQSDPSLEGHACTLETEAGSTEVNLDAQLREIEAGFFDLLESRNAPSDR